MSAADPKTGGTQAYFAAVALGFTVFVCGGSVMVFQFLVVRILARYFGSGLDAWAAVISVCLAGISIGYFVGGKIADRYQSWRVLGLLILTAGVLGSLLEYLAVWAGETLLQIDAALAWHPYIAAFIACFLPNITLGTVLPQAIRLQARQLEHVGATAGRIAAMSEVGSIAGVVMTAQLFIPELGVLQTLYGLAAVLAVLGVTLMAAGRKLAMAGVAVAVLMAAPAAEAEVLFQEYSAYHHIVVEDQGRERILRFDQFVQSKMSLDNPFEGGWEYKEYFHVPMILNPTIDRALFVGLGGGTGPKDFLRDYPHVEVDAVEIDPMVVDVAREYFYLPDHPRLNVEVQDGRAFLRRNSRPYGTIAVDAYASGGPSGAYIPYHLATQEFFELCKENLTPGGALTFNAVGQYGGLNDSSIRDINTTIRSVFDVVYVFQAGTSWNTVFVAMKTEGVARHPEREWPNGPWLEQHPLNGRQLRQLTEGLLENGFLSIDSLPRRVAQFSRAHRLHGGGDILTDDHAPVDTQRRR